jgi:hypothetical protein
MSWRGRGGHRTVVLARQRARKELARRDGKSWSLVEQTKLDYPHLALSHPEAAAAVKAEWEKYW